MIKNLKSFYETGKGMGTILFLIFVMTVLFIGLVVNSDVYGPMHFNDEIVYWEMTLDLYEGDFSFANDYAYPPFYPISILPTFYLFSPLERYSAVRWLHAIYIASSIFPVYLLLRRFTSRGISLLGAAVLVISPITLVIPRCVISENVFYPLLMWAVLLAFTNITPEGSGKRVLEKILFGVLLAILILTRYIALALVPGLLLIWWLKPFSGAKSPLMFSSRKITHLLIVLFPMVLILGLWIIIGMADGVVIKELLGFSIASNPNPAQLGKRRLLMWAIFYGSYTLLIAAPYLPVILPAILTFNLKKWQKDENRWWIALAIIVFCFLVPSIRHSWRVEYNYPDPVKLQGRYILYFGPLFLVSALGYIRKVTRDTELVKKLLLFLLSAGLMAFGYAILFEGWIYLDGGELGAAVNAPYGNMMHTMQSSFLIAVLLHALVITVLLDRESRDLLIVFTIFLVGFYSYGSVRVHKRILTSRQLLNAQVYNLVHMTDSNLGEGLERSQTPILLEVPSSSTARYARSWQQTLNFNGYQKNAVEMNETLDQIPALIFQADINGMEYQLIELDDEAYSSSENTKFTHSGKYYEYVPVIEQ